MPSTSRLWPNYAAYQSAVGQTKQKFIWLKLAANHLGSSWSPVQEVSQRFTFSQRRRAVPRTRRHLLVWASFVLQKYLSSSFHRFDLEGYKRKRSGVLNNAKSSCINPLECKSNYSAKWNNTKLVRWPLVGGLLHLVQREGDWVGLQTAEAEAPFRCSKCNSPLINGQCTNHRIAV